MAILTTGDFTIPDEIINPWLDKIRYGSAVAQLVTAEPMTYGTESAMIFDWGEAEYVGEGQAKSGSEFTSRTMSTKPYKFQKTTRWNEEVQWADEDKQLQVVQQMLNGITEALGRALDFGVFHGIDPLSGNVAAAMTTKLSDSTNTVEIAPGDTFQVLDAADVLIAAAGYLPTSIAIDPSFATAFTTKRNATTDQKLYPNFTLQTQVSDLDGHRASTSRTVSASGVATVATNIKGFLGDFNTIRWGIQRNIGLELIRYGDPDGQGDLKRNNQVAIRAEVLYGWGIADLDAVAVITDAV